MAISLSIRAVQNWQDIESNYSYVTVIVDYSWSGGSYNHNGAWLEIYLDGESNGGNVVKLNPSKTSSGTAELGRFAANVYHNADGTKTVYFSCYCDTGISSGTVEASGSKVLTQIPRAGSITAAQNFTDEQNPTISYSNPAGSSATVSACISLTGAADDIAYRTIPATGSSYTFNLTTAERNVLRNACKDANSRKVRFYVRTTIGSNSYLSYLEKTLTIVNANPTINPTISDIDADMLLLTGDANKVVRYYSNLQYATNAAGVKGATIKSYSITCGGLSSTSATGIFYNVESNSIRFTVTDSRGNSSTKTVNKTLVPYVKLTCNLGRTFPDTQGNFAFTVKGNYFNSSFGKVNNTLNVYYRWKVDGEFTSWQAMTATTSDNTYTAVVNLTGLDYQQAYTFQAYAVDKLATVYTEETQIKATPIFDWSRDDFNINGRLNLFGETVLRSNGDNKNIILSAEGATDGIFLRPNGTGSSEGQVIIRKDGSISFNGSTFGANNALWSGDNTMAGSQTINLSAPVSEQTTGIILVFSRYSNGASENANFNTFFIPKRQIALHGGAGCCFNMFTVNFGIACCKYLYIKDTSISGNDLNTSSGTGTSGIKYDNGAYALRYVIGV